MSDTMLNDSSQHDQAALRAIVARNPRKMTLQLARELGVPEVEIIRAFPDDRAVELEPARVVEVIVRLADVGPVTVIVSNGAATLETHGTFGGFSESGPWFNVQNESLDLHLQIDRLGSLFAVEKPGHMDGTPTCSLQWFDTTGQAAMKVFLNFGSALTPSRKAWFDDIRTSCRRQLQGSAATDSESA